MLEDAAAGGGFVLDGRRLVFEYSKPTSVPGMPTPVRQFAGRTGIDDWICTICGCANFARRVLCFQCNEKRSEDAPAADAPVSAGRRHFEPGPSHVLVVRGLDDNVAEEILYNEFSRHASIKDLRLVRDKYTQASRGFAFVHFHSVDDATKALNATNGTVLEASGQFLRVSYAKSVHGSGGLPATGLAAAAIEAAAFSQQYGSSAWSSKAQNPPQEARDPGPLDTASAVNTAAVPGFVWDEASGYYYDASSGFYYDGARGLYYDGNNGVWYTFNQETNEYQPHVEAGAAAAAEPPTAADDAGSNKEPSLAESVAAAALAAQASLKKSKEREKDLKSIGKKKLSDAVSIWKQRQTETGATRTAKAAMTNRNEPGVPVSIGRGGENPFGGDYQPQGVTMPLRSSTSSSSHAAEVENPPVSSNSEQLATGATKVAAVPEATKYARPSRPPAARTRRRFMDAPPPKEDK